MTHSDLKIGDRCSLTKTITEDMVRDFAAFTGDFNPVHLDEAYCRAHGLQTRIVHGMLVLSFLSTLIGMYLPGEGAVWMSESIDFISPVIIGDTLEITGEVAGISNGNAFGIPFIDIKVRIKNQSGHTVARGSVRATVK